MKRIISISCIAVSVLCLMALTVLPHHHHNDSVCFATEICGNRHDHSADGHYGHDGCSGHHHNEGQNNHGDAKGRDAQSGYNCAGESEFTLPDSGDHAKCKVCSCDNHNDSNFPVYFIAADLLKAAAGSPPPKIVYAEHPVFYKRAESGQIHALRAPPVKLS